MSKRRIEIDFFRHRNSSRMAQRADVVESFADLLEWHGIDVSRDFTCRVDRTARDVIAEQDEERTP